MQLSTSRSTDTSEERWARVENMRVRVSTFRVAETCGDRDARREVIRIETFTSRATIDFKKVAFNTINTTITESIAMWPLVQWLIFAFIVMLWNLLKTKRPACVALWVIRTLLTYENNQELGGVQTIFRAHSKIQIMLSDDIVLAPRILWECLAPVVTWWSINSNIYRQQSITGSVSIIRNW